ncbi:LamB/YcsF family protein [Paraclostridium bifermentans]|uniref:5-oxoprolinase subunit A n=1 Tax=Paraclostridium bifermentans TaxID=1490 RepID=A0A5P3XIR2_PARBF|nr:5-oxoprolinase subunit PxpA [Paraclostridium bifermentans]MDV8108862.1 5-oxoprolinase subunit PxpA [Bacillus sp. BAU-SS-2023]MCE9675802.1 LamB/YcsF family protein [Paraclostridium bifermentans]MCR1875478.1 LamB/YcsF family protein [Paraclostridium bifermentans]QEZ70195.1 LamB/YcsF family protein [Paraclostridium bifermentans]TQO58869.1 LamB/YcsF family protein [Paraclostridium bifermentans]
MYKVDLNSDLGESFGCYKIGMDEEVLKHITSANIACGFHAGDPIQMDKTVKLAMENNVQIGAHPGFMDVIGFGRREMKISKDEVKAYVKYQLGALNSFVISNGAKIQHVKAHGALYNMAAKDYDISLSIAQAVYEVDKNIILLGLANSSIIDAGKAVGLRVANEVFADRAYNSDGTLVSRSLEGSIIYDPNIAIKRVIKMVKENKVEDINGKDIDIKADSICVHGDNPKAIEFVKRIRSELIKEGINICCISEVIK